MSIRFLVFLLFVFLPLNLWANPGLLLNPNLNQLPMPIPAGTQLQPLCFGPPVQCAQQWSQQAVPMAMYSNNSQIPAQYQFYLPALLHSSGDYSNPEGDKNWRPWDPFGDSSSSSRRDSYYINKSNNSDVRIVSNWNGKKTVQGASLLFVPENNLSFDTGSSQGGDSSSSRPASSGENSDQAKSRDLVVGGSSTGSDSTGENSSPQVTVNQDSFGFYATTGEGSGCFTPGENTEAGFCFDCDREKKSDISQLTENSEVLSQVSNNNTFWAGIADFLSKASIKAKKKVELAGVGGDFTKICSADKALQAIIRNFNNSGCGKFKDFFKDSYCESCKQSIPPELMFAMMSIESAGRCKVRAKNDNEDSFGLFQINAEAHGCKDYRTGTSYRANTNANRQCLKNPVNNLMKGVDILKDHYSLVNPTAPIQRGECRSWSEMGDKEKDHWRKGVAAYNSGPGWVTRAIKSVKMPYNSRYSKEMEWSHQGDKWRKARERYKNEDPSWEEMRVYFLAEKLVQNPAVRMPNRGVGLGDKLSGERGSGRRLSLTLSNIAHVESALGRNADRSYPGMVDIWEQYIKKNKPQCL